MNAFFLFCKRHRSVVRDRYPHLENRSITKILGEWWATLEPQDKGIYTQLAKQYKEAFMRANPDFKWCKMPTLPTRTLLTRGKGSKGGELKSTGMVDWPFPHRGRECQRGAPDEGDAGGTCLASCSRRAESPSAGSTKDGAGNPNLDGGGDMESRAAPPSASKFQEQQGEAAMPVLSHPPMSCKPPKKRYLENMENGTYSVLGALALSLPSQGSKSDSSSSPSPSPSPAPAPAGGSGTGSVGSASRDQQTNSACSALLELAEGCAPGGQATPHPKAAVQPMHDVPVAPPGFGLIPMFDVSAANRIIDEAFSQPSVSTSPSFDGTSLFATTPTSAAPSVGPSSLLPSSSLQSSSSSGFFNFSSAKCLARSMSGRSELEDTPLNLSKERPTTTIKTSQQDIIDHIIEKFLCGPSNVTPMDGTVFSAEDNVPASAHIQEEAAGKRGEEPLARRDQPTKREEPLGKKEKETSVVEEAEVVERESDAPTAAGRGTRRKGVSDPSGQCFSSPCKKARAGGGDDVGEGSPDKGGDLGGRKSQRSCKGQRYQALLSEGMLVPGTKDRKGIKEGKKAMAGEDEGGEKEMEEGSEEKGKKLAVAAGPVTTEEEARKDVGSKKSSIPFNLDAQIAALPRCSMDWFTQKKKKKKGEEGARASGGCAYRDDCFQSDTNVAKDPDFRPSIGVMRRIRGHHRESAWGLCSPEGTPSRTRGGEGGASPLVATTPSKFKTGNFDLEEHLAALPKCDIEVLSRRRKSSRRDPGQSSSKQVSGCTLKETVEEGSALESAESDSTEENGAHEEWHVSEDEVDNQQDRGCSRQVPLHDRS